MKKNDLKFWILASIVFLFPVLLFSGIYTNTYFESRIAECGQLIVRWNTNANILLIISITIGALGVIIGALQKIEFKASKTFVIFLGALVSILTIIQSTAFDADRKTFKKYAIEGKVLNRSIKKLLLMDTAHFSPDDVKTLEQEIQDALNKFTNLEQKAMLNPIASNLNIIPSVYAQSSQEIEKKPEWVTKTPKNEKRIFFVGKGENVSLQKAKESAMHEAHLLATDYLAEKLSGKIDAYPEEIYQIAEKIAGSGEDNQTYFFRNSKSGLFEYYVLYALNRNQFENELANLAVQQQINYSQVKEIDAKLVKVKSPALKYYEKKNVVYDNLFEEARNQVGDEAYEAFSSARQLRRRGEIQQAVPILDSLLNVYPDFYLAWFNLALSYDKLNLVDEANLCYQKAAELETLQKSRDASIYNTYGYFLYRHEDFERAKPLFEKALEIDPNHSNAQKNLEATNYYLKK